MSQRIRLLAQDISCQHCAMTIQREIGKLPGIQEVTVDVPTQVITLTYDDEAALAQAEATLAEIGYPAKRLA